MPGRLGEMEDCPRFQYGARPRSRFHLLDFSLLLAAALAASLFIGLALGQPPSALAAGATYASCGDAIAGFSTDLAAVTTGSATFDFPSNCTIGLTSPLSVGPGVDVTINGNGLILDGQTKTFDVIDLDDVSNPSTLRLNQVTVENGIDGIHDFSQYSPFGTIILTGGTVSGNSSYGITTDGTVTVANSTASGNGQSGVFSAGSATVTNSNISGNGTSGSVIGIVGDTA